MKKKSTEKEKDAEMNRVLTVGEIIDGLKKLPKQAEVRFTDVCGSKEAELYQVHIDAHKGYVLLIGEFVEIEAENDDEK